MRHAPIMPTACQPVPTARHARRCMYAYYSDWYVPRHATPASYVPRHGREVALRQLLSRGTITRADYEHALILN